MLGSYRPPFSTCREGRVRMRGLRDLVDEKLAFTEVARVLPAARLWALRAHLASHAQFPLPLAPEA